MTEIEIRNLLGPSDILKALSIMSTDQFYRTILAVHNM
jgi:hypothetical protein